MERRKFLFGVGSTAVGASALVGSGAYTSATVRDREVVVELTEDNNGALIEIEDRQGERQSNPYVTYDDEGKVVFNFENLNKDAYFEFDQVVRVRNNGQNTVDLWFEHDIPGLTFYRGSNPDNPVESQEQAARQGPGEGYTYGVKIDTAENGGQSGTVDIRAEDAGVDDSEDDDDNGGGPGL